ncbi:unnamed protein product [Rotaria sordida]|uniref:Carbonic anhydrase n=1 Tax=Rotaria sordida TaxID=392033 RepID=A0A814AE45_9BILA|nr:unnamed protein product [Rotaria sordida]CAF0913139.1 unnamed protein product [Rotaria sordida]
MKTSDVCVIFFLLISISADQWNYGNLGPDIWSEYYPLCSGKSQSPINILTACTVYKDFQPFNFILTLDEKHYFTLKNNGHTIISTINNQHKQSSIELTGSNLNGTFEFVNFHLHWGEHYKSGSEHQINGVKYAGEIHFVYQNRQTSQLAVLGIFMQSHLHKKKFVFDKNDVTRNEWQKYFDKAQTLTSENDSISCGLNVTSLMGENLKDFWRYEGSLTTPPCTEGIIWTVFKQPIDFMEEQIKNLRDNVYFEDYRGPQPLYNRTVYRNFIHETSSSIPDYNLCLLDSENKKTMDMFSIFGVINCSILGPDVWYAKYPTCAGQSQSPINILTACTIYKTFTPFIFGSRYNEQHSFTLKNNRYTIVSTFNSEPNLSALKLTGGGLQGIWEFVGLHLHWGENHKSGSEHQVNGFKYAGEIHFIYMNPNTRQTAVLGIFMQSSFVDNGTPSSTAYFIDEDVRKEWRRFFDIAQTLKTEGSTAIMRLNLVLLMGKNLRDFWRYEGSLTTPPCTQGVIWTMFKEPIIFVESEFQVLRQNIYFKNNRGPQSLYTRKIYRNFFRETLSSIPDYNCCPSRD